MAKPETWEMIKDYFSPREFGEGAYENMNDNFLISLYKFRVAIDNPIIIHNNGGYSTKGHSTNSYHYRGRAIDFHFKYGNVPIRQIIVLAIRCGLYGIGFYHHWSPKPGGFHLDNRPPDRFQVWKKRKTGEYIYVVGHSFLPETMEEWDVGKHAW